MQVKKFEAPTIQEALETIKRELGPEAIILQTKKHKRGFGLMSQASVEVTAAVSERALQKKNFVETRVPEPSRNEMKKMTASRQADFADTYMEKHLSKAVSGTQDRVELKGRAPAAPSQAARQAQSAPMRAPQPAQRSVSVDPSGNVLTGGSASGRKVTATRYADIEDEGAPAQSRQSSRASTAGQQAQSMASVAKGLPGVGMTVEEELRHLKRMIEELKTDQEQTSMSAGGAHSAAAIAQGAFATGALQDAFEQLVINGIDKRYALSLIRQVGFELGQDQAQNPDHVLDQLCSEIMVSTKVLSPLAKVQPRGLGAETSAQSGPAVIALVGPTGVGKTTTVAKMASEALLRRNLKVGLINLDCYKVAAFDQLSTYAKILNVPFRSAASAEDITSAIADFHALDVILVDTTGRSQRDPNSLKDMQTLLKGIPGLQTQLVLSATTRDNELYDMANRFSAFGPEGIIISKLDEATIYGALYNVSQRVKLPLLYFTTGQRVPEDIEEATRERVAALIMDI